MIYRLGAVVLVLTACGPVPPEEAPAIVTEVVEPEVPEAPPALEQCDAADYRPLIGTPLADAAIASGERLRVFSVNDIITQEYLPQRTNVVFDGEGLITRVYCG
ncbi:MAG: hypothetical protein KJO30_02600 [Boseongicola sp.]|nr:hypothetical protein [Boseongicola sp.]NNJ68658.1 hypothetical protein [Boseongicola sp.]